MPTLADIYSAADSFKRRLSDAASNPSGALSQMLGYANDRARNFNELSRQAADEAIASRNPFANGPANQALDQAYADMVMNGIISPSVAKAIDMPVTLPKSKEFLDAVAMEPSASLTPEGLLLKVTRKQNPAQSGEQSVRTGVFYLPESQSANLKHYGGKTGYGGSEAIQGETLYKNPLFVKGATGGKAPEAAYDSLMGKGAYQQMRQDALRVRMNPAIKASIHPDEFLAQYAPELEGMGEYIYNKSGVGNQLPYALQEAAVANAVRNAGHDAVLGYSRKRTGEPFFSEIYDVRENMYPTKEGGYELHPHFQEKLK